MKIMRKLLFVLLPLVAIPGCSSPIGTIDASIGNGDGELLWAVPNLQIYNMDSLGEDRFDRESDLQIFTSFRGTVEAVPDHHADIFIVENPWAENPEYIPVNGNGNGNGYGNGNGSRNGNGNGNGGGGVHLFESTGRKVVIINFLDMETYYSIEVLGNGHNGNGNGGSGPGVNVEWY